MPHPLDGPIAKWLRAFQQTDALAMEIESFAKANVYPVAIGERQLQSGKHSLRVRMPSDMALPADWPLLIGEIAYNLRSSLDQLACQLAILNYGGQPAVIETIYEESSFPIFIFGPRKLVRRNARIRRWSNTQSATKYLSRSQRAALRRLQPYHRRNGGRRSPLWLLHELNNADKHRRIQVVAKTTGQMFTIDLRRDGEPAGINEIEKFIVPLKAHTKVGEVRVTAASSKDVRIYFSVSPDIAFWEGCSAVKRIPVMFVLNNIVAEVEAILREFKPQFPPINF